jgi:hypothetical protein
MECTIQIVSSPDRQILNLKSWDYVYIPMTENERGRYAASITNACWRIKVDKAPKENQDR